MILDILSTIFQKSPDITFTEKRTGRLPKEGRLLHHNQIHRQQLMIIRNENEAGGVGTPFG